MSVGEMDQRKLFFWLPRILAILFIGFTSLFAFDAFGTGELWYKQLLGFSIHLIPNFLLIFALLLAWRNEKIGGFAFILLYVAALVFFRGEVSGLMLMSPLVLIGLLFLYSAKVISKHSKKV